MTTKVTCPGSSRFMPSFRDRMRHFGGKILETRTRLHAAMPADRSASSNEVSFSRCLPTPLVKNISFGTNPTITLLVARAGHGVRVAGSDRGGQEIEPATADRRPMNRRIGNVHGKQ